ncbi:hypothetical protein GSI_00765 [Ganoderma sinense ZZ0214-1]|uniref:Uncharacterized protein n=1 Tax=Ganoderma sinense ZZ0214-1 TaxID=1077348 RepID=A0A2G8STN7_9APHY|nr:hypothetical protein GSI_00765 [Ganoderma sinense ZZ0214-1]
MNPTQIPFHSPFNFMPMGSQALPPPQPQIQSASGGPVGAAPMIMMPPFQQQQQAFQVPNFLLQAFQQQNTPQNTPQWILSQSQTPPLAAPPPPQGYMPPQKPPVSALTQYNRQKNGTSSQDDEPAPIGSDPDDEEMLIKTLQKAKARGITPRKALDKLDKRDRSQDATKFTEEDKVFFIHFLHWRLGQPGAIPSKQDLYDALGEQMTHHNAEAWKRHWDEHPELPDKVYIEARKRAEEEHLSLEPGQPGYARLADSSDEEPQEDDAAEAVADNASVVSYYDPPDETPKAQSADKSLLPGKSVQSASKTFRHPITEDNLRAMAKYKFEKRHVWNQYGTKQGPWKEFAERPENRNRKLGSWYLVSRDRAEELDKFYKQCLAEAEDRMTKYTPPRQDSGEAHARPFAVKAKTEKAMQSPASNAERPQKRGFERETGVLSPHKRVKQDVADMREYIEILDSSD